MAGVAAVARAATRTIAQSSHLAPTRGFQSGAPKLCYYDYEHRDHMYEIWNMKNRNLKFGLLVWGGMVGLGIAIPIYIVRFQMKKAQG